MWFCSCFIACSEYPLEWCTSSISGCYIAVYICHMKQLPSKSWCISCVHHTTGYQFTVSFIQNPICRLHVSCHLPPALSAELPGSFTCYCGKTGVEWILIYKNLHWKLTLEKIISPATAAGTWTCSLLIRSMVLYHSATPALFNAHVLIMSAHTN